MNEKLGQEPAFASNALSQSDITLNKIKQKGMSKRFYAACAAMQGILSNSDWAKSANIADDFNEFKERVTDASYKLADELLKQENQ